MGTIQRTVSVCRRLARVLQRGACRSRELGPLAFALTLAASCASSPQYESTGTSSAAIVGGNADTGDVRHANTTVFLTNVQKPAQSLALTKCSGTLIAPNVVVTAKHCVPSRCSVAGLEEGRSTGSS